MNPSNLKKSREAWRTDEELPSPFTHKSNREQTTAVSQKAYLTKQLEIALKHSFFQFAQTFFIITILFIQGEIQQQFAWWPERRMVYWRPQF